MAGNSMGGSGESSKLNRESPNIQKVLENFYSIIKNPELTLEDLWNVLMEIVNYKDIKSSLENNSIIVNINENEFTESITISDKRNGRSPRNFNITHLKSNKTAGSYCITETGNIIVPHSDPRNEINGDGKKLLYKLIRLLKNCIDTTEETITLNTRKEVVEAIN